MSNPYLLYIDGQWSAGYNAQYLENRNPARTDDVVGQFAIANEHDVVRAVAAAKRAFPAWRTLPPLKRGEILYRAAHLMEERAEQIARDLTREMGKPLADARGEVARGPQILRYYAGETSQPDGLTYPSAVPGRWLMTRHEPLGVVGIITPWNFPFAIPLWKLIPALAYGNTAVMKAAELTPLSAWHIADVLHQAGLPPGVFNLVTGPGRSVGEAIVHHPDVVAVTFTGSNAVGQRIHLAAAARGAKSQLEMGGKNPVIVTAKADLGLATEMIVRGAMRCSGQKCTATSRVLVERPVYGHLIEALAERIEALKVGDGAEDGVDVGPVISLAQRDSIAEYLAIGRDEARLVCGGNVLEEGHYARGYYVQPTLYADAPLDSRIMQEEIFGPVLGMATVDSLDEAIEAANAIPYGLSASLISRDVGEIMRFVEGIEAGLVHINDETAGAEPHVSFGGYKHSSSHSREQGKSAREFFTQVKTIYMDLPHDNH